MPYLQSTAQMHNKQNLSIYTAFEYILKSMHRNVFHFIFSFDTLENKHKYTFEEAA